MMPVNEREEIKIAAPKSKTSKDVILVAGEDEVRRSLVVKILSARGYKVEAVKETYNLLKKLEEANYQIVIIDIISLKEDPCHLLQLIKAESASAPIITLSDRNLINTYEGKLGLLTNKLLVSPLDPKDLLDAVGEISQPNNHPGIGAPLSKGINRSSSGEIKNANSSLEGEIRVTSVGPPMLMRTPPLPSPRVEINEDVSISDKKIIAIGGGKGGVGKSFVTANLAAGLAKAGKQVIAVDIDFSGPNLHTFFGFRKLPRGLFDFLLKNEMPLSDVACQTKIPGLKIIGISEDYPDASNMKYRQKLRLIDSLKQLKADYILLDLGSGATLNSADFFSMAGTGLVITSPEITSILNSYSFIKSALYRKMETYFVCKKKTELCEIVRKSADPENDMQIKHIKELESELAKIDPDAEEMMSFIKQNFKLKLVLNMVKNLKDIKIGESIKNIVKKYLDVDVEYIGSIKRDAAVEKSVISMTPLLVKFPASSASFGMKSILSKIISDREGSLRSLS